MASDHGDNDDDDEKTRFAPAPGFAPAPATAVPTSMPTSATPTGGALHTEVPAPTGVPVSAAPTPAPTIPPGPSINLNNVTIGTRINNNYEVKEVLKAGGMGEVYRGENVFTGDQVAIKVVLPELAEDEKVGLMFMREARTLSQLSDTAIVRYHNFVKDPEINRYCLIMEFISGVPLSDLTKEQGPIAVDAGRTLLRRLASGLDKAHALEVIHRDLSPDNVMLPDGIISEAVLIDFGIAKSNVLKEGTMHGQFAGKFKYVSPEQLGHFGGEIGPATDIYGLALLLAAALVGKPLDMGASIAEAVDARKSIPDLSAVPEALRPLLAYMLEPNPVDRPGSMADIIQLLDQPELLPKKYGQLPKVTTRIGSTLTSPGPTMVPGLLQPMTGAANTTQTAASLPPSTTMAPMVPEKSAGGKLLRVVFLVLVAALSGSAYYAWDNGLINFGFGQAEPEPEPTPEPPSGEIAMAPRLSNTREGFLAEFDAGSCTFANRISAGANAGMIQGFAQNPGVFTGLPSSYEEKFGARPTVLDRVMAQPQCPVMAFARDFQGRSSDPITISVDSDTITSGETLQGEIIDPLGRHLWLALVSPQGNIYNLTGQTGDLEGDRRSFRFGVRLPTDSASARQIILAIASTEPLINAAAAQNGVQASDLLPLLESELDGGRAGVVALTYLEIIQPAPEPEPEAPAQPGEGGGDAPADEAPSE